MVLQVNLEPNTKLGKALKFFPLQDNLKPLNVIDYIK